MIDLIFGWLFLSIHLDFVVEVCDHGNEHIRQENDGDDVIQPKHEVAHELGGTVALIFNR